MKNVVSTLVLLAVMSAIGYGVFYYLSNANMEQMKLPLNANKEVPGMLAAEKQLEIWDNESWAFKIEKQVGEKFVQAWAERDIDGMARFLDGDFSGSIPDTPQWVTKSMGPVEEKIRITGEQEYIDRSYTDFFELVTEPLFGVKIDQNNFQVLKIKHNNGSLSCKLLLEGSGMDDLGNRKYYRNVGEVVLRIATTVESETAPVRFMDWRTTEEVIRTVSKPMMNEITEVLGLRRISLTDNWKLEIGDPAKHTFQMAVEDFDLDGDYDIAIMTAGANRLILEYQDGKYRDVTKKLEIPDFDADPFSSSVFTTAWIDYNNDGYPDLLSGIRLFKNEGGKKFTRIKNVGVLLEAEIMGASVVDFDCDGLMDIYTYYKRPYGLAAKNTEGQPKGTANWIFENETGKKNRLYRNNGDGTFSDVTELTDTSGGYGHTQSTNWFFHDDDHYPDLFLANGIGDSNLLVNKGGKFFEDQSEQAGCSRIGASTGVTTGDVDNDGKSDLYVTGLFSHSGRRIVNLLSPEDYADSIFERVQGVGAGNRLFCRPGERYQVVAGTADVAEAGWGWGTTMLDLNSDGWLDIYSGAGFRSFDREKVDGMPSFWKAVVTQPENKGIKLPEIGKIDRDAGEVWMNTPIDYDTVKTNLGSFQRNKLFVNLGDGQFTDLSYASSADIDSDSRNVVSVDVDRDGATDLVVGSAGGGPLRVFSNQLEQGNRLEVRLKGVKSNSLGIGARITAEFADRKVVRDLFPQNTFMGTGPANVWLGLGDAEKIDKLTVRWPTGETQIFENVEVNRSIRIQEDNQEIKTIQKWD